MREEGPQEGGGRRKNEGEYKSRKKEREERNGSTFSSFANALSISNLGPASRGSLRWNRPAKESYQASRVS